MKKVLFLFLAIWSVNSSSAQEVQQKILVEHFTNTRCGTCASRNPAMFTLLDNYEEVHIAYYPSSPYASCIFSAHNKPEADARTNYYGIFGSTPRVVLNGDEIPSSSTLLQASAMDALVSQTTPFTIDVSHSYKNENEMDIEVVINTVSATTLANATVQIMVAEKLINYDAPNSEDKHPNVFRKAVLGSSGQTFPIPANGSNLTINETVSFHNDWNKEDLEIIVFMQDESTKEVLQSNITGRLGAFSVTSVNDIEEVNNSVTLFPNPVNNILYISNIVMDEKFYSIKNILGKTVKEVTALQSEIYVENLNAGIYFIEIIGDDYKVLKKFYKR